MENLFIDSTAKTNEIFVSIFIKEYLFPHKQIFVGDKGKKIPDIQIPSLNKSFEVVQVELEKDLDSKYIWKKFYETNGNPQEMQKFASEKFPMHNYKFFVINNKVASWTTGELGHSADYSRAYYGREIKKKLEKLNKGNYCEFPGEISLIISNYQRNRDYQDFCIFLEEYERYILNYKKHFKEVYLLTSNDIYIYDAENNKQIKNIEIDFDACVKKYKQIRNKNETKI